MTSRPHELRDLFGFLLDQSLDADGLIQKFLDFHGRFYFGHQLLLFERLRAALVRAGAEGAASLAVRDVLLPDCRLNPAFLQRYAPRFSDAYLAEGSLDRFTRRIVLAASANEWRDTSLPAPFNLRLGQPRRAAFALLRGRAPCLFVSPHGCQLFDPEAGVRWPAASSRAFARSAANYPRRVVEAPVAVLQDEYDAGNIAHFLYDYVPRILHIAGAFPDFARRCLFVLGGAPVAMHELLLERVSAAAALRKEQFVFPRESAVWELSAEVMFCTDQRIDYLHPLHMCHPRSFGMARALIEPQHLPGGTPDRVLVSRADAAMRQVSNEAELAAELHKLDFVAVRMSELDPATQLATLAHARHVVAPHGMGLAGLLFNRRRGSLLEIFGERAGSDAYAFVAKAAGMAYRFSVGQTTDEGALHYAADVATVAALAREAVGASS